MVKELGRLSGWRGFAVGLGCSGENTENISDTLSQSRNSVAGVTHVCGTNSPVAGTQDLLLDNIGHRGTVCTGKEQNVMINGLLLIEEVKLLSISMMALNIY